MIKTTQSIIRFSQAEWLEAAKLDVVINGQLTTQWPAIGVVVVLTVLCATNVPPAALGAMLAFSAVVAVVRLRFVREDRHLADAGLISDQLAHARRHWWVWVLSAVNWGLWPLLFFTQLTPAAEAVSWMLLFGVGGVAILSMSAHLDIARLFLRSFLFTTAASAMLRHLLWPEQATQLSHFLMPAFLILYGLLLLRITRKLNKFYHDSIDLSYHNARLIHSLREQQQMVQAATSFKERFLAGAAHDLKQPVNALGIYAEWLSNEPELVHELGPKILQSAQAINSLFDSLFDLVKLEAGRFAAQMQPVDVGDLLQELHTQFEPLAVQKGLTLRVRPGHAQVMSDPVMLRRVVANLLANAIRYTQRGGVLVAARQRMDAVLVQVWDTGIGIAAHEQERIFDEFYKVPASGTEEGFGLGLSIVRRLAERLGCQVSMRSSPGRGTMFSLRVPFKPQVAASSMAPADRSSGQSAGFVSGF